MPPLEDEPTQEKTVEDVADEVGLYPIEAYEFVQRGLHYTVTKLYGETRATNGAPAGAASAAGAPAIKPVRRSRHISGQELCHGLRDFALKQWGMLAPTVLRRWNITSTMDFGRIVFALVDNHILQKTEEDSIDDFRNVFDFKSAFDTAGYRIESK